MVNMADLTDVEILPEACIFSSRQLDIPEITPLYLESAENQVDLSDDEILPEARIFSSRQMELPRIDLKELEKLAAESKEGTPEIMEKKIEKPLKTLRTKGKKFESKRMTRLKKKIQSEPKEETVEILDPSLSAAAVKRLKRMRQKRDRELAKIDKMASCFPSLECEIEDVKDLDKSFVREINLKICYMSKIIRVACLENDKFSSIYTQVADELSVKPTEILLCLQEKIIKMDDTPKSLNLQICDIIDCIPYLTDKNDPNKLKVKIQSNDNKKRVEFYAHKLEKMQSIMEKYAKQRNIPLKDMVFEFDGEKITGSETPEELEMESGSCLDVRILNSNVKTPTRKRGRRVSNKPISIPADEMLVVIDINDSDNEENDTDIIVI